MYLLLMDLGCACRYIQDLNERIRHFLLLLLFVLFLNKRVYAQQEIAFIHRRHFVYLCHRGLTIIVIQIPVRTVVIVVVSLTCELFSCRIYRMAVKSKPLPKYLHCSLLNTSQ